MPTHFDNTFLRLHIPGEPRPAGSKKGFPIRRRNGSIGVSIVDANAKSKDWKALVSLHASELMEGELPCPFPLSVKMTFYRSRPKGHYGKGKNASVLKPHADEFPMSKPDVLKLARAVEDAMTGIVYVDDAQIVNEVIEKRWGAPGVEIEIARATGC